MQIPHSANIGSGWLAASEGTCAHIQMRWQGQLKLSSCIKHCLYL